MATLQRPRFGALARQVADISSRELEDALTEQNRRGGRIGEILKRRGLLTSDQVLAVIARQADWVATAGNAHDAADGAVLDTFLSVCMPAYNEGDVIEDCLDAACTILSRLVTDFEVVVVDDGSSDDTGKHISRCAARDPRVRLVRHAHNRGYGAAITSALRAARGDLVMFTDGDGQFSLLDLPRLIRYIDEADVVVGYRHPRSEGYLRQFNGWAWSRLIQLLLGVPVRDLDCAFKLFRRETIERLSLTATGACINAEIMAQCVRWGLTIREVPVTHYPRSHGKATGANLKVIANAFRELPSLWKYGRFARSTAASPPANTAASPPPDTAASPHPDTAAFPHPDIPAAPASASKESSPRTAAARNGHSVQPGDESAPPQESLVATR